MPSFANPGKDFKPLPARLGIHGPWSRAEGATPPRLGRQKQYLEAHETDPNKTMLRRLARNSFVGSVSGFPYGRRPLALTFIEG